MKLFACLRKRKTRDVVVIYKTAVEDEVKGEESAGVKVEEPAGVKVEEPEVVKVERSAKEEVLNALLSPKFVQAMITKQHKYVGKVEPSVWIQRGKPYENFREFFFNALSEDTAEDILRKINIMDKQLLHGFGLQFVFHGSPRNNISSILKNGLDPNRSRHDGRVFIATSPAFCCRGFAQQVCGVFKMVAFLSFGLDLTLREDYPAGLDPDKISQLLPVAEVDVSCGSYY